jgi:hypothetical protein
MVQSEQALGLPILTFTADIPLQCTHISTCNKVF